MNPSTLLSLLFTVSLIGICHARPLRVASPSPSPSPSPSRKTKLYQIVCKDAGKDNGRCLKLLEAYPKITSAKDYVKLCKYTLKMAVKKSIKGQNYLQKVMKKNPSRAIKQCATFDYDGLVLSFKSSLGELVESPDTANYDAKVAGDGPVNCQRALDADKIVNRSISKLNNEMEFLSLVAFLATNHLPQTLQ
ncbi:hypothetical protein RJT34_07531 [Clitoria ternatea]|uniref:Pectinesterase inhibitor domain-containing protein n=1 Tax=Clitoria ternatea TaxID=43366 RepID=A0AAN9K5Y7_CLITE